MTTSNEEFSLREVLHLYAALHLTGNDYARLCALANSYSDLSKADSAEYIALETKAKEPIFSALDKFSFADFFVGLFEAWFRKDEIYDTIDENLIANAIVGLPFYDIEFKEVLRNELTGNQMKVIEQFRSFGDNLVDMNQQQQLKIRNIVQTDEMSNAKKMSEIRQILGDYEKTIADFEAMCGVVIRVIKDFLGQPLFELYRGLN